MREHGRSLFNNDFMIQTRFLNILKILIRILESVCNKQSLHIYINIRIPIHSRIPVDTTQPKFIAQKWFSFGQNSGPSFNFLRDERLKNRVCPSLKFKFLKVYLYFIWYTSTDTVIQSLAEALQNKLKYSTNECQR